jgi:hypothetical protein
LQIRTWLLGPVPTSRVNKHKGRRTITKQTADCRQQRGRGEFRIKQDLTTDSRTTKKEFAKLDSRQQIENDCEEISDGREDPKKRRKRQ